MKKIPTMFKREFKDHKVIGVLPEFTNPICMDALFLGKPTVKFDGSCCAVIGDRFYKRYDAKKGKTIPENAIKCQDEPDSTTGHLPCWVPVEPNNPADKWFIKAFNNFSNKNEISNGTYEAIGPHFQGNPYNLTEDTLVEHGKEIVTDFHVSELKSVDINSSINFISNFLQHFNHEGIVFWGNGEPICKIKRTDFGFEWPIKEHDNDSN